MARRPEQPRIIDKRQTISGTEYLFSTTGEWVASSTCRCINPELVELYEWLRSSGYREGTTVFAPIHRTNIVPTKGARKRVQPVSSGTESEVKVEAPEEISLYDQDPNMSIVSISMASVVSEDGVNHESDLDDDFGARLDSKDELKQEADQNGGQIQGSGDGDGQTGDELPPQPKKQRLDRSYLDKLGSLTIDAADQSLESITLDPDLHTTVRGHASILQDLDTGAFKESSADPVVKTEAPATESMGEQEVREFNRNTQHLVEVYIKEGMDETGIEMFDTLLGPFRRPTKEFVASFFYAVILSPYTDHGDIEAAIHVLDRTLTLHGPECFRDIWDVQKRRREVADGLSIFSRQPPTTEASASNEFGLRPKKDTDAEVSFGRITGVPPTHIPSARLPSWNNAWDLIKAEFGLDSKPESRNYIALQESNIRMRIPDSDQDSSSTEGGVEEGTNSAIKEEQEIRDETGRAIVGLLLRILEQDAVLKNVSPKTFFCRDLLAINSYSPTHAVRQALDIIFQITALATSSRYLEVPCRMNTSSLPKNKPESTSGAGAIGSATSARPVSPWPLYERCRLNPTGMEILQLGQQFLLLLIRFVESGGVVLGKGLEELAIEVQSRLGKMNRDREVPGSTGSKRLGAKSSLESSSRSTSVMPYFLERCNLDQTEIFLKSLLQGPCLLDSGTGSGAGVKLRKENTSRTDADDPSAVDYRTIFKSQTGVCMGSSAFVMILVDYWFRSKTVVAGGNSQLSFRKVVDDYAMPGSLRPSGPTGTTGMKKEKEKEKEKTKVTAKRKSARTQKKSSLSGGEDSVELELSDVNSLLTDQPSVEQWNAKDLEQVEWTVMMIEVLVWSWIEARGIRREEIEQTGLEKVLYPETNGGGQESLDKDTASGWIVMSRVLKQVGGTLQSRWEQLESVIEAAIMVEDLGLR